MDPMKAIDPRPNEIVMDGGKGGKPVSWKNLGNKGKEPVREEMNIEPEVTMVADTLEGGAEPVEMRDGRYLEKADIPVMVSDAAGLTPPEERLAMIRASERAGKWIHEHPAYTTNELREIKKKYMDEERRDILASREKHSL